MYFLSLFRQSRRRSLRSSSGWINGTMTRTERLLVVTILSICILVLCRSFSRSRLAPTSSSRLGRLLFGLLWFRSFFKLLWSGNLSTGSSGWFRRWFVLLLLLGSSSGRSLFTIGFSLLCSRDDVVFLWCHDEDVRVLREKVEKTETGGRSTRRMYARASLLLSSIVNPRGRIPAHRDHKHCSAR